MFEQLFYYMCLRFFFVIFALWFECLVSTEPVFFGIMASFWNLCLFNWNIYKSRKTKLQNNNKTKTGIERVNTFCCCSVLALEQLPRHVQFVLYVRIIFIEAWANCQLIECISFSHRHGSITTLPINQFRGHSIDFAQIPL